MSSIQVKNGNYVYEIDLDTGAKIRYDTKDGSERKPVMAEKIDICITKKCSNDCPWCYMYCGMRGDDGVHELIMEFAKQTKGIEINITGGNPLMYPYLYEIINEFVKNEAIVSITINQKDINRSKYKLFETKPVLQKVHMINLSVYKYDEKLFNYINTIDENIKNKITLCFINGITSIDEINEILDIFPKVMIQGFRNVGRATNIVPQFLDYNKVYIKKMLKRKNINILFDKLAVEQLKLKQHFTKENMETYCADYDERYSMYIDFVAKKIYTSIFEPTTSDAIFLTSSNKRIYKSFFKQIKQLN